MFTITKPPMYNEWNQEELLDDYQDEEFLKEYVKSMVSTPTVRSYASIIEMAVDEILG